MCPAHYRFFYDDALYKSILSIYNIYFKKYSSAGVRTTRDFNGANEAHFDVLLQPLVIIIIIIIIVIIIVIITKCRL